MNSFKTGYKSHYNIPRDLFRCGGSRLEVFSRDVCFVFLDQYIFRKKKNSAAFSFYMFLLLIVQSMAQFKWHDGSVKNVHVDPTLLFDYQVCWCLSYSSVSFFFSDIFVMPNFPLSLERTDTTFRLLQKIADFICLW